MKTFRSRAASTLAVAAALSMTATPVLAHGPDDWRRHHHDGISGGDVLAGLLVVGGIAAIASVASKSGKTEASAQPASYPGGPEYTPDRPQSDGNYSGNDYSEDDTPPADNPDDGGASVDAPRNANPDSGYTGSDTSRDDSPGADYANGDSARADRPDDRHPESDRSATEDTQRPSTGGSFDAAVDACTGEIEHGNNHVGLVESVHHMNGRYSVEGRLENGHDFACSVDDAGQVRSVDIDGQGMI